RLDRVLRGRSAEINGLAHARKRQHPVGTARSQTGDCIETKTWEEHMNKLFVTALALALGTNAAWAEDTVKLAVGQRGNWDTSVSEIGQRVGIFKKHGLNLAMVYTRGAGETQQAVISGSVNIGIAAGVMRVIGAYAKGAPIRVISAET